MTCDACGRTLTLLEGWVSVLVSKHAGKNFSAEDYIFCHPCWLEVEIKTLLLKND